MVLVVLLSFSLVVFVDADSSTGWNQIYGGEEFERMNSLIVTSDGGYAMAGEIRSGDEPDFILIKADANGTMEWKQTYKDSVYNAAGSVVETLDGGYAMVGYSRFIKTDEFGNMELNKTYNRESVGLLVATADGGYAIAGREITDSGSLPDGFFAMTDASGNIVTKYNYGKSGFHEEFTSLVATSDGGYLLTGEIYKADGSSWSWADAWLVKIDSAGNLEWSQTYGGPDWDSPTSVVETPDSGYLVAGFYGNNFEHSPVGWLFKVNGTGFVEWEKTYEEELFGQLVVAPDGGYTLVFRDSLFKIDEFGNILWKQTVYGGTYSSFIRVSDGGYIIGGTTYLFGAGDADFWLFKTDEFGVGPDLRPPEVCIVSPQKEKYNITSVSLNFTVDEETSWIGYSLEGQENVTVTGNTTLTRLVNGWNEVVVYANDTVGNMGTSGIVFKIEAPLTVWVLAPENRTYNATEVSLNFTTNMDFSEIMYSLDGQENITIRGNTTLTELPEGAHSLTIYSTDNEGTTTKTETITFTIATETETDPNANTTTTWSATDTAIALTTVAIVIVASLLISRTKKRETTS